MATPTYHYVSSSKNWTSELAIVFTIGFTAATVLWVGLWFFAARPAQASAFEARGTELQQAGAELGQCKASVAMLTEDKEMLETEVQQLDRMLKNAWASAARRKQSKQASDGGELKAEN